MTPEDSEALLEAMRRLRGDPRLLRGFILEAVRWYQNAACEYGGYRSCNTIAKALKELMEDSAE